METELTNEDLNKHLYENLSFLKLSSKSFDSGFIGEAKRLATTTRVLLHDKGRSQSLLGLLDYKNNMGFYNTSNTYDSLDLAQFHGLVMMKFLSTGGSYLAPLKMSTEVSGRPNSYISFSDWWKQVVIDDKMGNVYSREDLVLMLTEKEGGAHVDPKIDSDYKDLNNRMGWVQVKPDGEKENESRIPDVELHSMRQIAYELAESIERHLDKLSD